MKKLLVFALFSFLFTATAVAQSSAVIVGKWQGEMPGQDGKPVPFSLTIAESTYQLDFGMDGKVDITGEYTSESDRVTIWDTAGENTCPSDQKGVYSFALDGDTLTFTKVTDTCPGRGDAPMVVKRM